MVVSRETHREIVAKRKKQKIDFLVASLDGAGRCVVYQFRPTTSKVKMKRNFGLDSPFHLPRVFTLHYFREFKFLFLQYHGRCILKQKKRGEHKYFLLNLLFLPIYHDILCSVVKNYISPERKKIEIKTKEGNIKHFYRN